MSLATKKCLPCSGEAKKLNPEEIKNFLTQIKSWKLSDDSNWIYQEFKFKNFQDALNFVNKIAKIAEEQNHHPNIDFTWGYCKISIQTHKINGLTENDFILAARIDEV